MGQADFGKLELNNRNQSGNCQRLVMNVIHLKHDQFKINAVKFSDLREEVSTRLSFAISSFFSKILYRQGPYSLINLRYFKVFTETSSIEGEPVEFPSTQANLHKFVILQAKCTIRIQTLSGLLYLSHPPETGNGGKRSFDKGSDEEEKIVFWYLAFLSSQCVKAKTINSH